MWLARLSVLHLLQIILAGKTVSVAALINLGGPRLNLIDPPLVVNELVANTKNLTRNCLRYMHVSNYIEAKLRLSV